MDRTKHPLLPDPGTELEFQMQCRVVDVIESRGLLFTATCGGMNASIGQKMKMKRSGYRRGVPDLLIFEPRGSYHGLMIELKVRGGHLSEHQQNWARRLLSKHYKCVTCWSFEDAVRVLDDYLALAYVTREVPYATESQTNTSDQ